MSRENIVTLHGHIQTTPQIYHNADGELVKAMFIVKVLRRRIVRDEFDNRIYFECPIILTKNDVLIEQIIKDKIEKNDMIDIKGVLTTKEIIKSSICPECKTKNSIKGNSVYITPIYLCKRESNVSSSEALELLKERKEISNTIVTIGTLCRDPIKYVDEKNMAYAQYQIAVNRKYRIKEDPDSIKTDYPWVKTIGEQALNDTEWLKTGSYVWINGAIQTREIIRNGVCENCGKEYEWKDMTTEIIPFWTEYLLNCENPDGEEIYD